MTVRQAHIHAARPATPGRAAQVLLHWLPLGAGAHFVAFNGRVYEALCARRQHRRPAPLFHAALSLRLGEASYVIEMGPAWGNTVPDRGVVVEGPVGLRVLGRSQLFRYEVRAWRGGSIPDLELAVGDPTVMSEDPVRASRLLELVDEVPSLTWGRDELGLGEMWNSNSIIAWLLLRSGHDLRRVRPPAGGRAPGWGSGIALAVR
ncbi:hypothetical protein [Nocardioides faecalis]|uniref:hypothetical protein n=1 Tax=Nocardioides faecalis TaxID=2803858 RepID=UPI0020BD8E91|nr:hypothetical protein [Nocardioides faecalis]